MVEIRAVVSKARVDNYSVVLYLGTNMYIYIYIDEYVLYRAL